LGHPYLLLKIPSKLDDDDMEESLSQQLEAKISRLKDALHYWKTWEAEYEGLKEELEGKHEPSAQEMVNHHRLWQF
jgi:hypothetical protein